MQEIFLPSTGLQAIDVLVPQSFKYQRIQLSKEVSLHLKKSMIFNCNYPVLVLCPVERCRDEEELREMDSKDTITVDVVCGC